MSDVNHLIIPLAASTAPGCQQALRDLPLPHLDRLLSRLAPAAPADAGEETDFTPPHERALARLLGLPAGPDGTTPWAAWHRRQQAASTDSGAPDADGDADAHAAWAFITPCQWQVSTEHVTLADPASLALDEAASRALMEVLSPWFAEDGITLLYDQPTRWLARGAVFDGLATASLDRVIQRDVRPWMPDAARARTLHRLHSEMQMLLYTHPLNDARAAQGLPPVNAFWVHGAGRLGTPPAGAAAAAARPTVPWALRDAALHEDWPAWAAAWTALDAGPVARLAERAAAGEPVHLTLCGERSAQTFHTAPRGLAQRIRSLFRPQRFADVREQL